MIDPSFPEPIHGQLFVDIPSSDENGNGFPDFWESSQTVQSARSQGVYVMDGDQGNVRAVWTRAAGSHTGMCRLTLISSAVGALPEFTASFELLEYTGTLTYSPKSTQVEGVLKSTQTGYPDRTLAGSVILSKSATNRFDQLLLQSGSWTNSVGQTWKFPAFPVFRDLKLKTNYFAAFEFVDGDPDTEIEDYYYWQLSIDDLNDADNDGIPDLSDDPANVVTVKPRLRIIRVGDRLELEIEGETGRQYEIQQSNMLGLSPWTKMTSVTMTNTVQTISLTLSESQSYWRAQVQ